MQLLPYYDDGAIPTLRDFEQIVYQHLNYPLQAFSLRNATGISLIIRASKIGPPLCGRPSVV
jgi:hypothetical protein